MLVVKQLSVHVTHGRYNVDRLISFYVPCLINIYIDNVSGNLSSLQTICDEYHFLKMIYYIYNKRNRIFISQFLANYILLNYIFLKKISIVQVKKFYSIETNNNSIYSFSFNHFTWLVVIGFRIYLRKNVIKLQNTSLVILRFTYHQKE